MNGEIVEDLLPSGSRLYIPRLEVSANYTCRVVNKAGAAEKSAFVFLISRECMAAAAAAVDIVRRPVLNSFPLCNPSSFPMSG